MMELVKALVAMADEELSLHAGPTQTPRRWSKIQLVSLATYNMNRVKIEWKPIWTTLAAFFIKQGCRPDGGVAHEIVVDLKNLSEKFLEIEEMNNFSFQSEFLRPFEQIMYLCKVIPSRPIVGSPFLIIPTL